MPTSKSKLTREWTKVATGPCYIEVAPAAEIHFGTAAPAEDTQDFHLLQEGRSDLSYAGSENAYARSRREGVSSYLVVTAEASQ